MAEQISEEKENVLSTFPNTRVVKMNGIVSVKFAACLMSCVHREKKHTGMYILSAYIMDFTHKLLVKLVE